MNHTTAKQSINKKQGEYGNKPVTILMAAHITWVVLHFAKTMQALDTHMMLNAMHFMRHNHTQVGSWTRTLVYGQHQWPIPGMVTHTIGMSLLPIG